MHRPFRFGVQMHGPDDAAGWTEAARKVEDLGYSVLTVADHVSSELAPIPALAAAAMATSTLRLGPAVMCNDFRHPAMLHKEIATLDKLSEGRVELGIGAGWMTTDYEETGIPRDPATVRIARLAESVQIIKDLFGTDPVDLEGEHYTIRGLVGDPRPVQQPHPPLLIGGGGPRILELAAREADIVGLNVSLAAGRLDASVGPSASIDATEEKLAVIRAAAGERFDRIELQSRVHVAMIDDDAKAMADELAPTFGMTGEDACASPHSLIGTIPELVDKCEELRERFGISYFTWGDDALDSMAPLVARLAGS